MINQRSSPGAAQWIAATIMIALAFLFLYKLSQFASERSAFPVGLTIGGVDVSRMSRDEAEQLLTNRFINAPVLVFYDDSPFELYPSNVGFTLDLDSMLNQADGVRQQQAFWQGFWRFLWNRPNAIGNVALQAEYDSSRLRDSLITIGQQLDQVSQPPQPVPSSLSFQYGQAGLRTNVEATVREAEGAFFRANDREVDLVVDDVDAERPDFNLLARLIVNHLEPFEGKASVFVLDLKNGDEFAYNADLPMSGMLLMRVPIVLSALVTNDNGLFEAEQSRYATVLLDPDDVVADDLLIEMGRPMVEEVETVDGEEAEELDEITIANYGYAGSDMVTTHLQLLGLENSFIVAPFNYLTRDDITTLQTPANNRETAVNADPARQTTAEDLGSLFSMIYHCAESGKGAIMIAFAGEVTQAECQFIINTLQDNYIGSLIEQGVPDNTPVAHRHGWINDTHGDVGIVYSEGGDYVLVELFHQNEWLEWDRSSPLMADVSRATYNYFNFDTPYFGSSNN